MKSDKLKEAIKGIDTDLVEGAMSSGTAEPADSIAKGSFGRKKLLPALAIALSAVIVVAGLSAGIILGIKARDRRDKQSPALSGTSNTEAPSALPDNNGQNSYIEDNGERAWIRLDPNDIAHLEISSGYLLSSYPDAPRSAIDFIAAYLSGYTLTKASDDQVSEILNQYGNMSVNIKIVFTDASEKSLRIYNELIRVDDKSADERQYYLVSREHGADTLMDCIQNLVNAQTMNDHTRFSISLEEGSANDVLFCPEDAEMGEIVEIRTSVICDADIDVYFDGMKLVKTHYDSDYWGYSFVMPCRNVKVRVVVYGSKGYLPTEAPAGN